MRIFWAAVAAFFMLTSGAGASPSSNKPSHQPATLGATRVHGHVASKRCSQRLLKHNDRGLCVRALQWLLGANDPAYRPVNARHNAHGHKCGANCAPVYWHVRKGKPSGHYGRATVLQVQTIKRRLGYDVHRANGAAGPKLRAYLLGHPLPHSYVDRKEKRYWAWHGRRVGPGPKVKKLMALASQAIEWRDHYYYTQGSHRSDFIYGIGPPWPKGGDCSASVLGLYKLAGLYNPSMGPVTGYTGSMQGGKVVWRAGQSLTRLHLGDSVFYGPGPGFSHVAMVISRDGARSYSFGNDACPCNNSTLYRNDAILARRYF